MSEALVRCSNFCT